jgi:ABC-type dipeptide/oligopeptide/nickel transport system permease subunit
MAATERPDVVPASAAYIGSVASDVPTDPGDGEGQIRARGYWEQVWIRFRRDKVAIAGGVFIIMLVLVAFVGAPIAAALLGHGPDDIFPGGIDQTTLLPVGPWTHVSEAPYAGATGDFPSTLFILGGDGLTGRDEFLRLLYGAQVSLEVAFFATVFAMTVGVIMGTLGGYFGGSVDTLVSRLTEIVMALPLLLIAIALASTLGNRLNDITLGFLGNGVLSLVLVIGIFTWYYPARIIRAQVLSLREKEFIEAARMTGASDRRIMKSHLLPHLVAPIIVLSTLVFATNILFEAGLSFLGVGIQVPTASWGNLLSTAPQFYTTQPWLMLWPGLAVLFTTLAFNLLGDGLRDAFDPRSSH